MNKRTAKTIGVLLLLTAIAVTQVPMSGAAATPVASDFEMDGTTLVRYSGTAEAVSIPDSVRVIGEEAFADNDNIVKVTIDGKVERIDYRAFADCDYLRTVIINGRVEEIDAAAFSNDPQLENVTLGESVKNLGSGVFAGCKKLQDITVAEENNDILMQDHALYNKDQTKLFVLLTSYDKEAYTLPSTVTEVLGYAFWGNNKLKRVKLGSGLDQVPAYAFSNCKNLEEVIIPLPVRSIEAKAFEDCVNLKTVEAPESISKIHDTAFDGCNKVEMKAKAGTYAEDFGNQLSKSYVDKVEYEDVKETETVDNENLKLLAKLLNDKLHKDTTNANEQAAVQTTEPATVQDNSQNLLGETSIVDGYAVVFLDNTKTKVKEGIQNTTTIDLAASEGDESTGSGKVSDIPVINVLANQAQKGQNFPKYTIVGSKIASQAFYQDQELSEYEIPQEITEIGEFAFARSNLKEITIPEGVTDIGYGAFYHCDQLEKVTIPSSVTRIDAYAFEKTPFLENTQTATYPYLIVGDGILVSYQGADSVVNIPNGVKQIAPGVFKDHMGVTAINIPNSVTVIGEDAFRGCKNLGTVNGGGNLERIEAGAFQDTKLSTVSIPATVKEIGLGAFALEGGTDTVSFAGEELPVLIQGQASARYSNEDSRTYAFGDMKNAIVLSENVNLDNTVLEDGSYGFKGTVFHELGTPVTENQGVTLKEQSEVILNSKYLQDNNEISSIQIDGGNSINTLIIEDSEDAFSQINAAYGELYGGREAARLKAFDMTLMDQSGTVAIKRLGNQTALVTMPIPDGITQDNLHMVVLDEDGQLEAVNYQLETISETPCIQFETNHFSYYGIYNYQGINGQAVVVNGKAVITGFGNKDNTPDTGDFLNPKWILAIGLFAAAMAFFLYKGKKTA